MKIHNPRKITIEIEKKDMDILTKAYYILDNLSSELENYKGIGIEYSVFESNEDDFYDFLEEMKGYICGITDKW